MKTSSKYADDEQPRPVPGSGLRPTAALLLLAEAALQVMEGEGAALIVCDGDLHIVAATEPARAMARLDPGATSLPHEIRAAVEERLATRDEGASAPVVAPGKDHRQALVVRVRRLCGPLASTVALTLEPASAWRESSKLGLSARDRQLVRLLRRGQSNRQIAAQLGLSEGTVKIYLHQLFQKLQVESRMQLVARLDEVK
jgi:DNA-binding NarL/FixJ family response regulator